MNVASQLAAVVEAGRADTAERRRDAERATRGPWRADVLGSEGYAVQTSTPVKPIGTKGMLRTIRVARCGYEDWDTDKANAAFIAALDPATVLRLCDQEDRHATAAEDILEIHKRRPHAHINRWCEYDGEPWPCSVLNIEAARWGIS